MGIRISALVVIASISFPFLCTSSSAQTWVQAAELTASDVPWDLGASIAMSHDTVVAGAPGLTGACPAGAVYVFVKPGAGWDNMTQTAKLTVANQGLAYTCFGRAVSISGDTVVAVPIGPEAFVFVKPATGWADMTQTAKLTPSNRQDFRSVAISGDTIVAGTYDGHTYLYVKPGGGWKYMTETAELTASDGTGIGGSLSISGDTVVASGGGAAYVFVKPTNGWVNMTETAKLTASNGAALSSVFLFKDTVAGQAQSASYVFVKPSTGWFNMTETAQLMTPVNFAQCGVAVGTTHLVACLEQGSRPWAYVFQKPQTGWQDTNRSLHLTETYSCEEGCSVLTGTDTVLLGITGANDYQGGIFIFVKRQ